MPVITLSRELGSGGIAIAQDLVKRLSWKLIDKEVIVQAAQMAKCSESQIEKFDQEQFDRMKVFFSDLVFPMSGRGIVYPFVSAGYMEPYWYPTPVTEPEGIDETKYLQLTKTVIQNLADEGNVIIVGRGGCVLLKDRSDTLHLRIIAPLEQRIRRLMETTQMDEPSAKQILAKRDKASADYLKHFYHVDWADPLLYHLVINTGMGSLQDAVELILAKLKLLSTNNP